MGKKPSKLENLKKADGKLSEDPDIAKARELEEILGVKHVNPFGTYNLELFKEKLAEMTIVDMQRLCERVGLFGSGSRQDLREKLIREFKSNCRGTIAVTKESPSFVIDPSNPEHQKLQKILGEI